MFQGAFIYNKKGLCHIWAPEIKMEHFIATVKLIKINIKIEAIVKEEWELTIAIRHTGL